VGAGDGLGPATVHGAAAGVADAVEVVEATIVAVVVEATAVVAGVAAVVVVVVVVVEVRDVLLPNSPPNTASQAINNAAHCRMACT